MKQVYRYLLIAGLTTALLASLAGLVQAADNAIARLNYAGFSKRGNCTATLISKTAALTAKHCVQNRPVKDIHLVFGYTKGEWAEHRRIKSIHSHKTRDIAILCLKKRSKLKPIPVGEKAKAGKITNGTTTGYKRSRPHLASTETCPFQAGRTRARFDCKLEPGMSGAPMMVNNKLVGVVSGTTAIYSVIELAVDLPEVSCAN